MHRNHVIKMLIEAGMQQESESFYSPGFDGVNAHISDLERFAKAIFDKGFFAGFNESGEGFNGEFPYGDKGRDPRQCKAVLNCLEEAWRQQ